MALALWFAMGTEASWMESGLMVRIARLAMLVGLGAAVYLGSLRLLGFRLRDFSKRAI